MSGVYSVGIEKEFRGMAERVAQGERISSKWCIAYKQLVPLGSS